MNRTASGGECGSHATVAAKLDEEGGFARDRAAAVALSLSALITSPSSSSTTTTRLSRRSNPAVDAAANDANGATVAHSSPSTMTKIFLNVAACSKKDANAAGRSPGSVGRGS